jgi:acyl-CoA synthetase (NDP forming)
VLKGGITGAGTKAATSHTGALSGTAETWSATIKQSGGIQTYSVEEFVDTALAFNYMKSPRGKKLGVVSISGGLGVNLSDLVVRMEFDVQAFDEDTQKELGRFVNTPGTCVQNPIDLAITFMNIDNYKPIFSVLDENDSVDIILIHFSTEYLLRFKTITPGPGNFIVDAMAESLASLKKPIVTVLPYTIRDEERKRVEKHFLERQIPVWPTIERALISIDHYMGYYRRNKPGYPYKRT